MFEVSVIIPNYNSEKHIGRLVKSVKNQTVKCEIIVVDDGSVDKTVEIAKKFADKVFPREHKERSIQRNFGASKASGKYLLFLDSDMELTSGVVESCLKNINGFGALIIPERTVGVGFMARIRKFEREMYMGDPTVEVARFFPKKIFNEFGGYDTKLTGAEDYDLPKRVSNKYRIGWAKEYILHHETGLTLSKQLKKKYYYAQHSALYVEKHPDLISKQGILIFRKAYLKNWTRFFEHPILGVSLLLIRFLESISAILGFISSVGLTGFVKTFFKMIKYK
ncbi:glycosyltransferase family 2 protein [Candidatus Woesebacteria bacterium]|nr:glycosyltransferase family 2 protein [Candidatus Woesebacteria bacterium]